MNLFIKVTTATKDELDSVTHVLDVVISKIFFDVLLT